MVTSYGAALFLTRARMLPMPAQGLPSNELLDWAFVQSQIDIIPDLVGLRTCHRLGDGAEH